jgi:hypothetical protein
MGRKNIMKFKFIGLDKKEYLFQTEKNNLNGHHMWTINEWRDCYAEKTKAGVNSVIKAIKKSCQVIET